MTAELLQTDGLLYNAIIDAEWAHARIMLFEKFLVEENPNVEQQLTYEHDAPMYCGIMELATRDVRGTWDTMENVDDSSTIHRRRASCKAISSLTFVLEEHAHHLYAPGKYAGIIPSPSLGVQDGVGIEGYVLDGSDHRNEGLRVLLAALSQQNILEKLVLPMYEQYYTTSGNIIESGVEISNDFSTSGVRFVEDSKVMRDMRTVLSVHLLASFHRAAQDIEYDPETPFDWQFVLLCERYRVELIDGGFQNMLKELFAVYEQEGILAEPKSESIS